jgi:hypothetical protein
VEWARIMEEIHSILLHIEKVCGIFLGVLSFLGILQKPLMTDPSLRYPPYNESKIKWVKLLNALKWPKINKIYISIILALVLALLYSRYFQ